MARLQIIGAGHGRTGTMSLCKALEILGSTCHHMESVLLDPTQKPDVFTEAYKTGKTPNWDDVFEGYNAAVDWPSSVFWEDLLNYYPEAKIILTTRDAEKWYNSVQSTVYEWPVADESKLPARVRAARNMAQTIVRNGVLKDFDDKEKMMQQFNEHSAKVQQVVPAERLLVFQPGDGWEPLCRFLEVEVPPDTPFPHLNKKGDFKEMVGEYFKEIAKQESAAVEAQT